MTGTLPFDRICYAVALMAWVLWLAVPAIVLALLALRGSRDYERWWNAELRTPLSQWTPPATIVVPVKGMDDGLKAHLHALAEQHYPDFELIVAAWEAGDIPPGAVPRGARVVLASELEAPVLPGTGAKVRNLIAAVKASRASSQVIAFGDSDGQVPRDWLRALVSALDREGAGVSTGFRVYVPARRGLWSLLRSVWDAVIFGNFGPSGARLAWGGAMAIRRADFVDWRVFDYWNGAVSDDYRLASAARANDRRIVFTPRALVVNPSGAGGAEFLAWIRRQAVITRVYRPKLWALGMGSHVLYCASMAACAAGVVVGEYWLAVPLAIQIALGMVKGSQRRKLLVGSLPGQGRWFRRLGWLHIWATPIATWLWLYAFVASASSNAIEWRGSRYRLSRPIDPPERRLW